MAAERLVLIFGISDDLLCKRSKALTFQQTKTDGASNVITGPRHPIATST
ncbi:MAG: hypothetical protein MZU95_01075 [Desulfomicrobium escambiense]|nr:hypothetical protein [Desulfomicrobium escambiense]